MRSKLEIWVSLLCSVPVRIEVKVFRAISDEKRGKSMVLHSTVETRVGLLKDEFVQMDMQHRKQEQRIENMVKDKEAEVSMVLS